jgi:hypothetical protein
MFEHWDSFYLLLGSAAGALIGLLFVVATLTSGLDKSAAMRGASIYLTPTVFHFAMVLTVSALALAPGAAASFVGLVVGACAAAGLAYAVAVAVAIRKGAGTEPPHWSDFWCYGVAPSALYVALGAAAIAVSAAPARAPYLIAAPLVALLLTCIRNAWDLVTYLAPRNAAT